MSKHGIYIAKHWQILKTTHTTKKSTQTQPIEDEKGITESRERTQNKLKWQAEPFLFGKCIKKGLMVNGNSNDMCNILAL